MTTAYCFDLDGTITREEILPVLAHELGLYDEISMLTDATIAGLLPFKSSFLLRCKLLGDIPISTVQSIVERISLANGIVDFISKHKESCFVITGNLDVWIAPLLNKVGCQFYCSEASVKGDKLIKVERVLDKAVPIDEIRSRFSRIVTVGDGMGDIPMFENSDIKIAYGGVHSPIETLLKLSNFVTYEEQALCRLLNTL